MAKVTVTEAAKLAGLGRQQLYRGYISTGKISVERDHQGRPQIDTAEILRVFGEMKWTPEATQNGHNTNSERRHIDNELQTVVEAKDDVISELRERLREAGEREGWLRQQLERAQAVLTNQSVTVKRRWWQFWG
jgi:predicted site-specific integrase-resolvase